MKKIKDKNAAFFIMIILLLMGMYTLVSNGETLGKIELCEDMGGVLAGDGKCYDEYSFKMYNETRSITKMWYDPTQSKPDYRKLGLNLS